MKNSLFKNFLIFFIIFIAIASIFSLYNSNVNQPEKISLGKMVQLINDNQVKLLEAEGEKINLTLKQLTKTNTKLIIKLISQYYKKKIKLKLPNDILINKKKICGILQETIQKNDNKYLIVGIGLNLIKSPKIKEYPTTNLYDLTDSKISVDKISREIKNIYTTFLKSQKVI